MIESLLVAASFVCSTLMFYFSFIHSLPKIFMHFILKFMSKQNKSWNVVEHLTKRTHEHRSIVVPCPDLLYSTVACDFSAHPSHALLFSAPVSVYSSLGLYDDTARCVGIVSHSAASLRVVVVGPEVTGSDADIRSSLRLSTGKEQDHANSQQEQQEQQQQEQQQEHMIVRRMPTAKGLLLHRLLMDDPSEWAQMQALQSSAITCTAHAVCESSPEPTRQQGPLHSLSLLSQTVVKTVGSFVHVPTALPCVCLLLGMLLYHIHVHTHTPFLSSVCGSHGEGEGESGECVHAANTDTDSASVWVLVVGVLVGGLVAGAAMAFFTLKQLKKPRVVQWTKLMKLEKVGDWSFNALDTTGGGEPGGGGLGGPFVHLIFFLHGALGLLPTEVYYGAATAAHPHQSELASSSSSMLPLQHGESYVIDVCPSLDLRCAWWSLTVYGSDLFLVPNDAGIYSVNSFQLQKAAAALQAQTPAPAPARKESEQPTLPQLRIVCSPTRPEALLESEGEVFWLPMPQPLLESQSDQHHPPRFVLRGKKA